MDLVTGEAADYRTTTIGMEAEIIRDDDKILATVSASWKELAAVLRALYQQELDGFSHTPVQREAVRPVSYTHLARTVPKSSASRRTKNRRQYGQRKSCGAETSTVWRTACFQRL